MTGRPDSVQFPQVWLRFERTLPDGTTKKFKIQDVTEDLHEDVVDFMVENFLKEEAVTLAAGVFENERALQQIAMFWKNFVLPQRLSLVCLEDTDSRTFLKPPIVALNFLIYVSKNSKNKKNYPEPPELLRILDEVESKFDMFKRFNIMEYVTAAGLAVNKDFRGMSIGAEILKARTPLCKAIGVKVTETIFSGKGSQILATKAGFETLMEIKYEELGKKLKLQFPEWADTLKVMTKVID